MKTEYLILGVVAILLIVLFIRRKAVKEFLHSPEAEKAIKGFIVFAEKVYVGDKKGKDRLEYVCERVRDILPSGLRAVVTTKMLVEVVEYLFEELAQTIDGHKVAVEEGV